MLKQVVVFFANAAKAGEGVVVAQYRVHHAIGQIIKDFDINRAIELDVVQYRFNQGNGFDCGDFLRAAALLVRWFWRLSRAFGRLLFQARLGFERRLPRWWWHRRHPSLCLVDIKFRDASAFDLFDRGLVGNAALF